MTYTEIEQLSPKDRQALCLSICLNINEVFNIRTGLSYVDGVFDQAEAAKVSEDLSAFFDKGLNKNIDYYQHVLIKSNVLHQEGIGDASKNALFEALFYGVTAIEHLILVKDRLTLPNPYADGFDEVYDIFSAAESMQKAIKIARWYS